MVKWTIIGCYVVHKIWWKRVHSQRVVKWQDFLRRQ